MRLAALLFGTWLIPTALWSQQTDTVTLRDPDSAIVVKPDEAVQYFTGARFSDVLLVRGERVGLRVSPAAGPLGLVGRIRFRGPQTISDDRLPLLILDGVRLDLASGILGGTARLQDLNPEDIESVEILSPAQAARYGPDAANGALIVRTRQGRRGSPQWRGHAEVGTRAPSAPWPAMVGGFDAGNPDSLLRNGGCTLLAVADGRCTQDSIGVLPAQLSRQFQTALQRQYGLSVQGGWKPLSYYVSGEWAGDGSVLSLSQDEIDRLQSVGQSVSGSTRNPEHFGNMQLNVALGLQPLQHVTIGLRGLHVSQDSRASAFLSDQPETGFLYDLQTGYLAPGDAFRIQDHSSASRWLGSVDFAWTPTPRLTLTARTGHDGARVKSARQGGPGVLTESVVLNSRNTGLGADYDWKVPGLTLRSHLAFESNRISRDSVECASAFSPNCTSGVYRTSQLKYWQNFWSLVLEQRALIGHSLEIVGTLRRDRFKYFDKTALHPALHTSWWHGPLHVHADYGSVGRRPFLFSQPERTRELSAGADLSTHSGRLTLGGTAYDMRSRVFAYAGLSGSSGFYYLQVPATIGNRGIELYASALLVARPDWTVTLDASAWGNRNRLASAEFPVLAVENGGLQQRFQIGLPVGGFWAYRPPTYADTNGNGIIERSELSGPMEAIWAGTPYPTQGATLAPEVRLRSVRFGTSFEYQAGHTVFNRNRWFVCADGHCPAAVDRSTPFTEQADVAFGLPTPRYFEDGDFLAWRELWATVEVPATVASAIHVKSASITLMGRNLHTWTGYSGISPEPYADAAFGDPESFAEPVMPALQQWSLRVRVSY